MSEQNSNSAGNNEGSLKEAPAAYSRPERELDSAYPLRTAEDQGWIDFRNQCRRQMQRSMDDRIEYGFFRMHKPVLDDAPWRAFKTMTEYRAWCEANLPDYLGFKRAQP
jgi:hypothetical protein